MIIGRQSQPAPAIGLPFIRLLQALAVCFAINLQVSVVHAQASLFSFQIITNPSPVDFDYFAKSVAVLGVDRVLVGTPGKDTGQFNAGSAYLFNTNGMLLMTFTNPTPAFGARFGESIAAVGHNHVLIGAPNRDIGSINDSGIAYLFSTNGTLLTTFNNPRPTINAYFGYALSGLGGDKVIIGAYGGNTGSGYAGVAYMFSTNGTLITTLTNPGTGVLDGFGVSVAGVGTDLALIGSGSGSAYLFNTNGTLVRSFSNPGSGSSLGYPVAAVGDDAILIGGSGLEMGYLFNINGTLLTTFINPRPAILDYFVHTVAGAGYNRVLIGAYGNPSGSSGVAFLFGTDGTLRATLTNHTPSNLDDFGLTVSAVNSETMLVGAPRNDSAGSDVGVAYLFSIPPNLTIQLTTTNSVVISWSASSIGWILQENTNGLMSVNWRNVESPIEDDGKHKSVIVSSPTGERFYRLFKP